MKEIHSSRGSRVRDSFPPGRVMSRCRPKVNAPAYRGLCRIRSTTWWASGFQSISPLRGPARCRQGNDRPAVLNAFTHAVADPVAAKVANRCARAPRTAVSGSRMTWPAAS